MSFSSIRRVRAVLLPLAVVTSALGSTGAHAVPNSAPLCASAGVTVDAHGATFQANAQAAWRGTATTGVCAGSAGKATYTYNTPPGTFLPAIKSGSGTCVEQVQTHTTVSRTDGTNTTVYPVSPYCGSDDALTTQQWVNANSTGGVINHIPVALGAVTVSYNNTDCPGLVLDSHAVSDLFEGLKTTWNQVTDIAGGQVCNSSKAITRVVRDAVSGTTWIFRDYLRKQNPQWNVTNQTDPNGPGGIVWPNPGGSTIQFKNGNGGVADGVKATDGAVGYVDLATAISKATVRADVKTIAQAAGTTGTSAGPNTDGSANCDRTGLSPTPPHSASPGWDQVTISDAAQGYPICGFTYALVFTNPERAFNGATTPAKIQAGVDLLLYATSTAGQNDLKAAHYALLPTHAQVIAQNGLASIVFDDPLI